MKVIFLASGKSSRISPIKEKCLLKFCGQSLIIHQLNKIIKAGFQDIIIVANDQNKEIFRENLSEFKNVKIEFVVQKDLETGMAGGVLEGLKKVKDSESILILSSNDIVDDEILANFSKLKKEKNIAGALLAKKVDNYFPGGYLKIDKNNRILEIIEKPPLGETPSDLVNIVVHYFSLADDLKKALIESLENSLNKNDDAYEMAIQSLLSKKNIIAIEYDGFWQAIKYPWHILEAQAYFLEKLKLTMPQAGAPQNFIDSSVEIADTACLRGNGIFLAKNVKIFDNAVIVGPCYIGENSVVGNNSLIRESNIGKNCEIGFSSEIARSFLADNVSAHHAYIGDSVVDENVNFGAFSCTANLRVDKAEIKTNVKNSSSLVGINRISSHRKKLGAIVGKNAQIGAGVILMPGEVVESGDLRFFGK